VTGLSYTCHWKRICDAGLWSFREIRCGWLRVAKSGCKNPRRRVAVCACACGCLRLFPTKHLLCWLAAQPLAKDAGAALRVCVRERERAWAACNGRCSIRDGKRGKKVVGVLLLLDDDHMSQVPPLLLCLFSEFSSSCFGSSGVVSGMACVRLFARKTAARPTAFWF